MQAELQALEAALSAPERPVGAVVGGAKVSTKIDLLQNLVQKLDDLFGLFDTFQDVLYSNDPVAHGHSRSV